MNPLQFKDLLISFTSEFLPLWNDKGSGAHTAIGLWRPSNAADALGQFFSLGDVATNSYRNINQRRIVAVVSEADKLNGTALRPPDDYELVWKDTGSGARTDFSIWQPLAPEGYAAMGQVCGVGYEKPSRNAVRCVRADLVASAQPGQLIWSDKGSGAPNDFSAWTITPPDAAPGELHLAPGTFIGNARYTKPTLPAYTLRLALAAQLREPLPAPALTGYDSPADQQIVSTPQVCELPWFSVKDPELSAIEQLQTSPIYRLERNDRHLLAGFGHNTATTSQPFMWTATKGEIGGHSRALASTSCVDLCNEWPPRYRTFELGFSANLEQVFSHTQRSAKGWNHASPLEIITYVPAKKAVAAYLIQSEYRLLRQDGSQVSATVSYTNGDQVYMSEFPAAEPAHSEEPAVEPVLEVTGHDPVDNALTS
jgi:hypothetical protein